LVVHTAERGPEVVLVMHLRAPAGRWFPIHEGQERPAVTGLWHLSVHPLKDGGHNVNGLRKLFYNTTTAASRFWGRIADHQRNPKTLVAIADLAEQVMVAELLAMITGEDDQRLVILPGRLEMPNDPAEVVVDLANQTIVGRAHDAHLRLGHSAPKSLSVTEELRLFNGLQVVRQERMLLALDLWG